MARGGSHRNRGGSTKRGGSTRRGGNRRPFKSRDKQNYNKKRPSENDLEDNTQPYKRAKQQQPTAEEFSASEPEDDANIPDAYSLLMDTFKGEVEEESDEDGVNSGEDSNSSDEDVDDSDEDAENDDVNNILEDDVSSESDQERNSNINSHINECDSLSTNIKSATKKTLRQKVMYSLQEESAEQEVDMLASADDPFSGHFERCLSELSADGILNASNWINTWLTSPTLGKLKHSIPGGDIFNKPTKKARFVLQKQEEPVIGPSLKLQNSADFNINNCFIKESALKNVGKLNPLQEEILSVISNYTDLYYPESTHEKWEDITKVYSLHAVNHILKTRARIINNNYKLTQVKLGPVNASRDKFGDQGLARPKVLVLLPSRHTAYRTVKSIAELLQLSGNRDVQNLKRFEKDFGPSDYRKKKGPADFKAIFAGDTSDDFKIGITINKKSMRLYTGFDVSDIILASPLGLRLTTGVDGEESVDRGFLSSIEIVIIDQADIIFMQNWLHVLAVIENLNKIFSSSLKELTAPFLRVRNWMMKGLSSLYRQTILFSSAVLDHHLAFVGAMHNFAGRVQVYNPPVSGSVTQILARAELALVRVPGLTDAESRLNYFKNEFLPQHVASRKKHTLLFIPDYCDYQALHFYLSSERCIDFSSINEYIEKDSQIAAARSEFFSGNTALMLYTERYHFYHRPTIKGVRHVVFYDLPTFPHYFPEVCNMMLASHHNASTGASTHRPSITVLYQKSNVVKLSAAMGTKNTKEFINAQKSVHICTVLGR